MIYVANIFVKKGTSKHISTVFMKDLKIINVTFVTKYVAVLVISKLTSRLFMKDRKITNVNFVTKLFMNLQNSKDTLVLFISNF